MKTDARSGDRAHSSEEVPIGGVPTNDPVGTPNGASAIPVGIVGYAPALLLVILALVFFDRLTFSDFVLARGDTFAYFYPYWEARNAALMAGRLPLWSPDLFMGVRIRSSARSIPPTGWSRRSPRRRASA
jgi:hypothetical protein